MTLRFPTLEGTALAVAMQKRQEVIERAKRELRLSDRDLIVRQLRPQDVGLANPEWTFNLSSGANSNIVSATIADNRFIMIYGLSIGQTDAQTSTRVTMRRGTQTVREWNVQGMATTENNEFYFTDPILIDQNTVFEADAYTNAANSDEKLCFIGVVAERKGLVFAD